MGTTTLKLLKFAGPRRLLRVELAAICTLAMALGAVLSIRPPALDLSMDGFFISNAQAEEIYIADESVVIPERALSPVLSGSFLDRQLTFADNTDNLTSRR